MRLLEVKIDKCQRQEAPEFWDHQGMQCNKFFRRQKHDWRIFLKDQQALGNTTLWAWIIVASNDGPSAIIASQ
jgi:hypothetical protein